MVEAMEIVEMYCDLILARFGLVTQMKELDEGLAEAISTLIWVAPRMHTDVQVRDSFINSLEAVHIIGYLQMNI